MMQTTRCQSGNDAAVASSQNSSRRQSVPFTSGPKTREEPYKKVNDGSLNGTRHDQELTQDATLEQQTTRTTSCGEREDVEKISWIGHTIQFSDVDIRTNGGDVFVTCGGNVQKTAGDPWLFNYSSDGHRTAAEWLSSTDHRVTHNNIARKWSRNTGWWFLQSGAYDEWCTFPGKKLMWCPGIPGVGKSVMASLVVDHLRTLDETQTFVGIIYFNYKTQSQQSRVSVLEGLCRQMYEALPSHDKSAFQILYDMHQKAGSRPTEMELREILSNNFSKFRDCYIVLDALDEWAIHYSDKRTRKLVQDVFDLADNVRLLITSRILGDMETTFREIGASRMEIIPDDRDMRVYLEEKVVSLKTRVDFTIPNAFSEEIVQKVMKASRGRFLIAELGINLLAEQHNLGDLEDNLNNLPNEVDETYSRVMELISNYSESRKDLAMNAIMWIAYSERHLTVGELQHALAVKTGRKETKKYITPISTITALCAGVITVQDRVYNSQPEDERIVEFVHFTAQEFFATFQQEYFGNPHKRTLSTCLEFLSITTKYILPEDFFWDGLGFSLEVEAQIPFYDYAALNWGYHANAGSCDEEVLDFLLQKGRVVELCCQYMFIRGLPVDDGLDRVRGCSFYLAAYHNQAGALVHFMQSFGLLNNIGYTRSGRTPLHIATIAGKLLAVEAMLAHSSVDLNTEDELHRTPFWYAVQCSHEAIVKVMLKHGNIDINTRDKGGQTPLLYAAQHGHDFMVKLMLEDLRVLINRLDSHGRTPLSHAAVNGHASTLKHLLAHAQITVNARDHYGCTALCLTCESLNSGAFTPLSPGVALKIIQLLVLQGGADVNRADSYNNTPLYYAKQAVQSRGGSYQCIVDFLKKNSAV